jgi:hypothetical protein
MIEILLLAAGGYLLAGLAFALPFVLAGAGRIDPHAARGSWGFRAVLIPGAVLLWPLLARRWWCRSGQPPPSLGGGDSVEPWRSQRPGSIALFSQGSCGRSPSRGLRRGWMEC